MCLGKPIQQECGRVLLVGEEPLCRTRLESVLEPVAAVTRTTPDGFGAALASGRFLLVCLDAGLGGDVVGRMLAAVRNLSVPLPVMVIGSRDAEAWALDAGADEFVAEDAADAVLLARLRKAVREGDRLDSSCGSASREEFLQGARRVLAANDGAFDAVVLAIDHYGIVKDVYGERVRAAVTEALSSLLEETFLPRGGVVGRMQGDEFAVLCPHRDDWPRVLDRLLDSLTRRSDLPLVQVRCGIYAPVDRSLAVGAMFERASLAADRAQGRCGRPYAVYDDALHRRMMEEMELVSRTPQAIARHEFMVVYQPKYRLDDGSLAGAEALVRWNHPAAGMLGPDRFVPLFERTGLISSLDVYVWEETCRQIASWKRSCGSCPPVSVNLSRVDVGMPRLADTIDALVAKHGLVSRDLHLEVTESTYATDPHKVVALVQDLRRRGYAVEMDDFGSGFSSLNMLAMLPVDILKLDMKLLKSEEACPGFLAAVLQIAGHLGVPVVAEGVETLAQAVKLKELGCQYAQGYFYGKPMDSAGFGALIGRRSVWNASVR